MEQLISIAAAFLIGAVSGALSLSLAHAAKRRDTIYDDDYYDHDVSGLLEED